MGELTEQIFSVKQNQNIKEVLTRALSILNIRWKNRAIVLKPEQEMAILKSLLHRRDVTSGNFVLIENRMIAISPLKSIKDDQISECCH